MENLVLPNAPSADSNDGDIGDDTVIDGADILNSDIAPLKTKFCKLKVDAEYEEVENSNGVNLNAYFLTTKRK